MDSWTIEEIIEKSESEGLVYMIESYLSADKIADPELAQLWRGAQEALAKVSAFLDERDTAEPELDERPLSGVATIAYEQILCDTAPAMFEGAPTDEYGYFRLTSAQGGTFRLNVKGGRFGSDPQVYIKGAFDAAELFDWLRHLEPAAAAHIAQTVTITDAGGSSYYVTFAGGRSNLNDIS
jgi:hypothetical protein